MDNNFFDGSTVYLFELSDRIFKELSDKMSIQSEDRRYSLITDIKEYIREHITEDISLASVAQQFNISAGSVSYTHLRLAALAAAPAVSVRLAV